MPKTYTAPNPTPLSTTHPHSQLERAPKDAGVTMAPRTLAETKNRLLQA